LSLDKPALAGASARRHVEWRRFDDGEQASPRTSRYNVSEVEIADCAPCAKRRRRERKRELKNARGAGTFAGHQWVLELGH
jgi:hypothetical protein